MVSSLRMTATRASRAGLPASAEPLVEAAQRRIAPDRDQTGHIERRAHRDPTALDASLAAITAAIAVHRRDARQSRDLVAIDGAEFRQFDDQRAGDDVADARDALEQVLLGAEHRAVLDQLVDGAVDALTLGLQAAQDGLERTLRELVGGFAEALLLGVDHDHELAASREQLAQAQRERIGHRLRLGPDGIGEMGDDAGIDGVGLGEPADRAGEFAHLTWVDDGDRQAGLGQRRGDDALIAAARLHGDELRPQRLQAARQVGQAVGVGRADEPGAVRANMHVDPALGDVDADETVGGGRLIHHPSSSMRARAQTTVRAYGRPAGATRSLAASRTRNHSGYRPGSAGQRSNANQAMPR